jgi:hypothetical protein
MKIIDILAPLGLTLCAAFPAFAACSDPAGPGVDWTGCNLAGMNLSAANLPGANLTGANMQVTILVYANLMHANLKNVDWAGTDLRGATWNDGHFCAETSPEGACD